MHLKAICTEASCRLCVAGGVADDCTSCGVQVRQLEMERFSLAASADHDKHAADRLAALDSNLEAARGNQQVPPARQHAWQSPEHLGGGM